MFSLLLMTLPTQPNAVRLRIWRALKALGCVALRDGAYVLPLAHEAALEQLASEAKDHGGTAQVLALSPRDELQKQELLMQFDRSGAYAQWLQGLQALRVAQANAPSLTETEARRQFRAVAEALASLGRTDYYPGAAAAQAQDDLAALRRELDNRFSKGEPHATDGRIQRLDIAKFQGKRWATRARPWVDRMACAWLISRFIDPQAKFVWLADLAHAPAANSRSVIGFDYDGARFTHIGNRVSFEVLIASFGLDTDAHLQALAPVVHYLDAGGIPVALAPGLEAILGGLREMHANDDALIQATHQVFDALYAMPAPASASASVSVPVSASASTVTSTAISSNLKQVKP